MEKERGLNKKAQVTLFIIIAIVIIAIVLLVYFLVPGIRIEGVANPKVYVQKCAQDSVSEAIELLGNQGGVIFPQDYILFQDSQIEYLCYTSEYYKLCKVQKPFVEKTIESEIAKYSETRLKKCFGEMENDFKKKGYEVQQDLEDVSVDIIPNNIIINIKAPIKITKESTSSFENFKVTVSSHMFNLANIATNIIRLEATYGDSEISKYMLLYPNIKVEKLKQGDGSTIYILEDRTTKEKFVFASRSLAWPPGYGIIT